MLKLDVPLNVTIFGGGLFPYYCFIDFGSLSYIDTLTASKVRTLDWNIKKSDVSTLTTMEGEGIINLTQIIFFYGEYSI